MIFMIKLLMTQRMMTVPAMVDGLLKIKYKEESYNCGVCLGCFLGWSKNYFYVYLFLFFLANYVYLFYFLIQVVLLYNCGVCIHTHSQLTVLCLVESASFKQPTVSTKLKKLSANFYYNFSPKKNFYYN